MRFSRSLSTGSLLTPSLYKWKNKYSGTKKKTNTNTTLSVDFRSKYRTRIRAEERTRINSTTRKAHSGNNHPGRRVARLRVTPEPLSSNANRSGGVTVTASSPSQCRGPRSRGETERSPGNLPNPQKPRTLIRFSERKDKSFLGCSRLG